MAKCKTAVKQIGNYQLGRTIGRGSFAKVKLATDVRTGQKYALKILDKERVLQEHNENQITREIISLRRIRHPHVVRLYEVLANRKKIFIVLEHVSGGQLLDKIIKQGKLEEAEARRYFQQIIGAVGHCHDTGVYNRDLKLDNILLDENNNVKVSDFGLSALPQNQRGDGLLHTACGSPHYVAPEVLANKGYEGAPADVWSCGVILFVLLTGCLPFQDRSLGVLFQKIVKGDYTSPNWMSTGARNLINRILVPNPKTRISVAKIMEDEWFKQGCSTEGPDEKKFRTSEDDDSSFAFSTEENFIAVNAFQLIAMSRSLDFSGFFEEEDVTERRTRFLSPLPTNEIFRKIEDAMQPLGFRLLPRNNKEQEIKMFGRGNLYVTVEVLTLRPFLHVLEIKKGGNGGQKNEYTQLCAILSSGLERMEGITCHWYEHENL